MALALAGCGPGEKSPDGPPPTTLSAATAPPAALSAAPPVLRYLGHKPWNRNPTAPGGNATSNAQHPSVDLIARNGLLFVDAAPGGFVDAPRPKLALVFTGPSTGYIEPCGCAGMENMKGGLSRRDTFLKQLTDDGWTLVKLDLGGQVRRTGPQAVIKYQRTIAGLRTMGYQVIGLGLSDLRLPATDLIATLPGDAPTHLVSANVGLLGFDNDFIARFRVIKAGGLTIGVTGVTGADADQPLQNADVSFIAPAEGLKKVVPQLLAKHCDKLVLLANTTPEEASALARQFPQFDLVVMHGESDPPPKQLAILAATDEEKARLQARFPDLSAIVLPAANDAAVPAPAPAPARAQQEPPTRILELSHKGMYAGVVSLYDDAAHPERYQCVPLDARFSDSQEMKELMVKYQEQLRGEGLERLGALGIPHPSAAKFVGSQTCGQCHEKAFAVWQKTPHAQGLATLEKLAPPRQFDPECLSCHVTGWEPSQYLPFLSGFESRQKTPQLAGNGCENCHGPGSQHVAAENGGAGNAAHQKELRNSMRLTIADAQGRTGCTKCHDVDNSPTFKFETFWPKIEHHGKD